MDIVLADIEAVFSENGWEITEKDATSFLFEQTERGTAFRCFIVQYEYATCAYCMVGNIGFEWQCSTISDIQLLSNITLLRRQLVNGAFLKAQCKKVALDFKPEYYTHRIRICVRCEKENTLPHPDISLCQKCIQEIADNLFRN